MTVDEDIRKLNVVALDPSHSVVISACAGSGKTWLLVSRIVRLLLDGVKPSEILAITFTRKAAQEMQARLHDWLHFLATEDEQAVIEFLRAREVPESAMADALPRARGLFEMFLTDQPGITVSTFHGWFLHLLKRAPLASGAGSGANLVVQTSPLIAEAWELFAENLLVDAGGTVAKDLHWLFEVYGLENTRKLLMNFLHKRAEWWSYTRSQAQPVAFALENMRAGMPVAPDADVMGMLFEDSSLILRLEEFAELLRQNQVKTDVDHAIKLHAALHEEDSGHRFELVWPVFFKADSTLRVRKESKAMSKRLGARGQQRLLSLHDALGRELETAASYLLEQAIYKMNKTALSCGVALLERYQAIKHERGVLDYTDIEWRAWLLLIRSDHAEYMHYKLDARYQHILLDEFQDANPLQWQIMKSWLEASADVESEARVFLVGDPKQSIYRFRRAEPRLFDIASSYLQRRHAARMLEQNVTRRNAPAVVSLVNRVFDEAMPNFHAHLAYQRNLPGLFRLMPLAGSRDTQAIDADDADLLNAEPRPAQTQRWRNPLEHARAEDDDLRRTLEGEQLASHIADMVGRWQVDIQGEQRPLRYQDVLVLVARRTHLDTYERALRQAQIPFVSSRHGGLLETLEVADLTALLQFLVVPFVDLHLAAALRSPIFSASNNDLMLISSAAGGNWWQRLCTVVTDGSASEVLIRAHMLLERWMAGIDLLPVHDLLDRIYFESDLINRYEAAVPASMRAGVVANLRAFMELALSTDSGRYPSLQGFLHELSSLSKASADEAPDVGVMSEGMDAVRILTVHGSKGLEAPLVWLLDANAIEKRADTYDVLVDWPPESEAPSHFSLFSRKEERGQARAALFEQDARLAEREDMNLLYVAMTRAQQVFIASGIESRGDGDSWYRKIEVAAGSGADSSQPLSVIERKPLESPPPGSDGREMHASGILSKPMRLGKRSDDLLDPHRRRGIRLHALLEKSVPPVAISDRACLRDMLGVTDEEFDMLWKDSRSIVEAPALARFFDPRQYLKASNEFTYVSGEGELRRIDRVVEFDDAIWVLDYKTGDAIDKNDLEAAARPYRKQLAEYRVALSQLIPEKPVRSALIFKDGVFYPL